MNKEFKNYVNETIADLLKQKNKAATEFKRINTTIQELTSARLEEERNFANSSYQIKAYEDCLHKYSDLTEE